jgi:hypothetical protein
MADAQKSRDIWPPQPGYFRMRLVKKGWRAPAEIRFENGLWQAIIDGDAGEPNADPLVAGVDQIWHYGQFIDRPTYDYLNATREWARAHDGQHPAADATRPINPRLLKPITV